MAKKQIFNTFADLVVNFAKNVAKETSSVPKTKRPRISVPAKKTVTEQVKYKPIKKYSSEEIRKYNAWNKYKHKGIYATMPENQAYKVFSEDWDFRHDPSRIAVKNLSQTINSLDKQSGTITPNWIRRAMGNAVSQKPDALMSFPPPPVKFGPKSRVELPEVNNIKDYFSGHSYRGIDNVTTLFKNATMFNAPIKDGGFASEDAAMQFLTAGLKDAAGIMNGTGPTSFEYKPKPTVIPMSILEEITAKRKAPSGTAKWLHNINVKNPGLSQSYLDLFAKHPDYFKQMFDVNGNPIK